MIRRKPFQRPQQQQPFVVANHFIRVPEVRVLSELGEMLGVMPTAQAMQMARDQEKDLILVTENAQPPIAKIIHISKYRYQLQQKKAEGRKKAKVQEIKELRFKSPYIGESDLQVRVKRALEFLKKGDKVRLTLEFKGRDITKQDLAHEVFAKVFAATSEVATIEIHPKMMGKKMLAQLMPVKKGKTQEATS
jgi:translation initiation factor IF-3